MLLLKPSIGDGRREKPTIGVAWSVEPLLVTMYCWRITGGGASFFRSAMCSVPIYGPKGLGVHILDYGPLILSEMYVTALRVITRNEGSKTFCRNKMVSPTPGRKNPPCMVDIHWTHYFFYVFAVGTVGLIVYGSLGRFTSIRIRTAVNFTHCGSCMLYIYIQQFSPSNT